jgi:hypothetical protein
MKRFITVRVFLLVFFLSFLLIIPLLNAQKIKIKTENGIPVVYNPKKPAPPPGVKHKLILEEELCIGDEEEEYLFSERADYISTAIDDEWNIFTLDPKLVEIRKFNAKGKLIKIFGKKGQGPKEMDRPSNMMITPQNELMFIDGGNSRLTFYSLDGEYLRYIPFSKWRPRRIKIDSKGNIVTDVNNYSMTERRTTKVTYEIKRFNKQLEPLFTIFSIDISDRIKERIEERKYSFGVLYYWQLTKNDNVIIGDTKNYEFSIINPEGKIIRKIKKELEPVKVTKEDTNQLSGYTIERYILPKYHTGFYYFTVDEEGRLFVRTWERTKDKRGYFYDVFDSEGRYIAKIPIKAFIKRWLKGKLLTVEETEDGFPVVKRYKVIWK